jgi:CheY-like chemotaxis protein
METKNRILLVDDDPDFLALYQELLRDLPGKPEIHTASTGARALAMLESEPFRILVTDLKMPRMDGLQVLTTVRRKYPELRTIVLTSIVDEQFRSRVYALGVDLFWQKPTTEREVAMFKDCLQSLIERETQPGFRGVQSKSLVDIIQLECLSQSSSVLRITNGPLLGRIWINHGELFDAEAGSLTGEEAFRHILSWKTGSFEVLSPEPNHAQNIKISYSALLLESAQAIDEARGQRNGQEPAPSKPGRDPLGQMPDLTFFLALKPGQPRPVEARGLENPEGTGAWAHRTLERFNTLGDRLQVGQTDTIVGLGQERHLGLTLQGTTAFCIGWRQSLDATHIRKSTKKASALWAS